MAIRLSAGALACAAALSLVSPASATANEWFQRVGTMPVHQNGSADEHTAAEIAAATPDGRTIVYTDSPASRIGFALLRGGVPRPAGVLPMPGEPTSVDIAGGHALVAVNTSASHAAPSGALVVVELRSRRIVARHELGGQPDSIDVSPDGRYAAVAIENERDEDVDDGALPQAPAGFLTVVDLRGAPAGWSQRRVELTGIAEVAPSDPEPEYVSVNARNQAAVTLQENNHIAVVDLPTGRVVRHFSAGTATVAGVDTADDGRIDPSATITAKREPDAIAWLDERYLGTADEGDYQGGSRTWTVFDSRTGAVVHSSGNELEQVAIRQGQYPDGRSDNKGVEPEGLAVASFGRQRYAFVGLERANLVAVYDIADPRRPRFVQAVPTGVGPEGVLPIPAARTLVVSAEEDSAEDGIRSSLSAYRLTRAPRSAAHQRNAAAPSIVSRGIGFGALSGLSAVPGNHRDVVAVTDAAYAPTRVLTVDTAAAPAVVRAELPLTRDGGPVGYDAEGIAARPGGGYWIAAEGDGDDLPNLLVEVDARGRVVREVALPEQVAATATGNGFEGVAVAGEHVWVAVQRPWKGDRPGEATLARYTPATGAWAFAAYPLDKPATGWVGLSELTAVDSRTLLVLERDNQRGDAAAVKRVYRVDVGAVAPVAAGGPKPVVAKRLVRDLLPALTAGGATAHDKPEGLALVGAGPVRRLVGAVDNDGVDDAPGESVFLRLGWFTAF
ncbi:esterase-like activity of phytase family protein [Actinokineospora sp. NPDC004072]